MPSQVGDNMNDKMKKIDHQSPELCCRPASVILDSMPVNGSLAITHGVTNRKFPCSPVSASSSIQAFQGITHRARNDLWKWKVVSETEWNGK
jgi:hypothetical protein